jgi:hypothetical protein
MRVRPPWRQVILEGMALAFVQLLRLTGMPLKTLVAGDTQTDGRWPARPMAPRRKTRIPPCKLRMQRSADCCGSLAPRAPLVSARAFDDLLRSLGSSLMLLDDLRRAADVLIWPEIWARHCPTCCWWQRRVDDAATDGTPPLFLRLFPLQDARRASLFLYPEWSPQAAAADF